MIEKVVMGLLPPSRIVKALKRFIELESFGGIVMMATAALALVLANSAAADWYKEIVSAPITLGVGGDVVVSPLKSFTKDVLMVLFFFAVGMELKQELVAGVLSRREQVVLPLLAAVGGMAVPALVYLAINAGSPDTLSGWAIPSATDIAFALAILLIFARTLPPALKVFLLAVAIFDDLGAILMIGLFYSSGIDWTMLAMAGGVVAAMVALNRLGATSLTVYIALGTVLAVLFTKAGIHSTVAGVVTGLVIPIRTQREPEDSPLEEAMHLIHPWVTYLVLPLFAFVGAGVSLKGVSLDALLAPLPLGIAAGLFVGKQIGVMGATWLAVRTGLAALPDGITMRQIYRSRSSPVSASR
ncbi:MAG: Na+/H+ antiporter NhaA [Hyphomicrobiaceae bacterium]